MNWTLTDREKTQWERNNRIKYALNSAGITQDDLAKNLGLRQGTISDRLTRREVDSIDFVKYIAKLTKRRFADLAALEPEAPPAAAKPTAQELSANYQSMRMQGALDFVPIMDVAMSAGPGYENGEYVDYEDTIAMPHHFLKSGQHIWGRVRGLSMAPTFQDSGYVCVRKVEPGNWEAIREEYVYLVITKDGQASLKRVKNRLRQHGHLTLMSDNPDKAVYGNFDVRAEDIHTVWEAEWYLANRFPDVNRQFYQRISDLEDKVERHELELEHLNRRQKQLSAQIR
jgi:phage repressor protein C with HTH and peptisase S24 domain